MERSYTIIIDGEEFETKVTGSEKGLSVTLGTSHWPLATVFHSPPLYSFLLNDKTVLEAEIELETGHMNLNNVPYEFKIETGSTKQEARTNQRTNEPTHEITAPMPGKITDIKVKTGDKIAAGTAILTIEAMKMQNDIFAQTDCTIAEILVKAGQTVEAGQKLVTVA